MNLSRILLKFSMLSGLAALALVSVHAATVSYSTSTGTVYNNASGTLYLPKFDTGLGTLTGVSIVETIEVAGSAIVTAPASGTNLYVNTADLKNKGTLTGTGLSSYSATAQSSFIDETTYFDPGQQTVYTITPSSGSKTSVVASGYFDAYAGAGNAGFNYVIGTSFLADSSSGFTFTSETTSTIGLSVTYTYDAFETSAVPEPSVYAAWMGCAAIVFAFRRRRTS